MGFLKRILFLAIVLNLPCAWAQQIAREPHIGYIYPAGVRVGTTVDVLVGGQNLRGTTQVFVSGEGVDASVVEYARPLNNQTLQDIGKKVRALLRLRKMEEDGISLPNVDALRAVVAEGEPLPDHPLVRGITEMSFKELMHWTECYLRPNKRQMNAQIAEIVVVRIKVASSAALGDRELRLQSAGGLTNPLRFEVSAVPEQQEHEPNEHTTDVTIKATPPVILNGQIFPGDVDRFRFTAKQGQTLLVKVHARALMPFLADAVPGWFQPVLTLYDARGKEIAYADDYRYDPDPVLVFEAPQDGDYELEIHDALYRGREDFVYRIAVGEFPFITCLFPAGGQMGKETVAKVTGVHLDARTVRLDTAPGDAYIRWLSLRTKKGITNRIPYHVDTLPEVTEIEPNDNTKTAQSIGVGCIVNGRIQHAGDSDFFQLDAKAGTTLVVETIARRLCSPLDSLLYVFNDKGEILAWNDDAENKFSGVLTHDADSYLTVQFPADGTYYIQILDAQRQGGQVFAYRLRVAEPRPDFELFIAPSGVTAIPGGNVPLHVYAARKDGFQGDISIALKNPPPGFALSGNLIPAAHDHVIMTLTVPRELRTATELTFEGNATIEGKTIKHAVRVGEDMMQAFIYRHLVEATGFLVTVLHDREPWPPVTLLEKPPIQIAAGSEKQVRFAVNTKSAPQNVTLELIESPAGIRLDSYRITPDGIELTFACAEGPTKIGNVGNLVAELFMEISPPQRDNRPAQKTRISLGCLPAIPVEIVRQQAQKETNGI